MGGGQCVSLSHIEELRFVTAETSSQTLTGREHKLLPSGVSPIPCQTCCCSRSEERDPVVANGLKTRAPAMASSLRQEWDDRGVIREELWHEPPPPPSLVNCSHLFPCSVLFRSDFLARGAAGRTGGGARTADGENLGKIASVRYEI